ncbi:U6 snRNA-associated Sm-like protein LSm7 [Monocercomonoides exilis]|uniref:U6 snRNA-associated Sm-like protein LSm7 n=1 Tax=Monocercomonoides exilis TaxID=2049356 RepID=UPI00355A4FFE|nr:U6 snRNA-associated Sm-like protein LSm7 [Monocercomonoides exilis]|eukprot:MONOS_375.1-p1 / transcript=MONOS_375.1 / gene=MONOS_375 / organism=Monocercomonoides_exilis_PA203 / gene_product=U6 snRNA-associated Sm-like protein LSm7 / transcript_product=U6 snRNA-associated Sm-like protein LSm7 / location=Mono_scaffold00006:105309-105796(+) / protein_length=96 / sequence_SO=supercontig / SO=protein_coding / is_pseudo=false
MQGSPQDVSHLLNKRIHVKLTGGREVEGLLKGFDTVNNLVLDECIEITRDVSEENPKDSTRNLGLVICRGTSIICSYPTEGTEEIDNPYTEKLEN